MRDNGCQEAFLLSAESTFVDGAADNKAAKRSHEIRRELVRNRLRVIA